MENIGGGLGFRATLDIDDFKVSAAAMAASIRKASLGIQDEARDIDDTLLNVAKKGAEYITTYLVGQGLMGLIQTIISTRGEFQQLEIAFETMLGSATAANSLMKQMVETAAKTPFDLKGVAEGAKQLLAYGVAADKVNDTLVRLGNIASGLSIPLNDIVYLYGTTMVQGRLFTQDVRQFTGRGIPLVRELAEAYGVTADEIGNMVTAGKIGFADVEKVLNKMTDAGGQFYNLMEKQSASLTGMIANVEDAWDTALDEIGNEYQDVLAAGINTVGYLVEHLTDILKVVKAVAVAFGTYKASLVLVSLATKGVTGVALIDNTVRQAKLALLKAEATLTGKVTQQTKAMEAAQAAQTAGLEAQLSAEDLALIKKQMRISAINSLLTAQQSEYLSNIGLTESSAGYEAAALSVLSVEQKLALSKIDLTAKSETYRLSLQARVAANNQATEAALNQMRVEVQQAEAAVANANAQVQAINQKIAALQAEKAALLAAGSTQEALTIEQQISTAQEELNTAAKTKNAAATDLSTKKKQLETLALQQSVNAGKANIATQQAQVVAESLLSQVTGKVTGAFKALWATLKANPLGWILSLVSMVMMAFTMFKKDTEEATDATGEFNEKVNEETKKLQLLFSILENTADGTKTHKDALEKVNAICKEYNKTLLDENSTLGDQKKKYEELTQAIQQNTAEKIKAKYIEKAGEELTASEETDFTSFSNRISNLKWNQTGEHSATRIDTTNIKNMSDEVKESIRSLVNDAAKELSKLTGDEYANKFSELYQHIIEVTQSATGATEQEMHAYGNILDGFLNERIAAYQNYNSQVATISDNINKIFPAPKKEEVAVETDYTKMSFEELEGQIKSTQDAIDKLNNKKVKIEADNTELQRLKDLLDTLTGAVTTKTESLNTENGINARVKTLKEKRANVDFNSDEYKTLTKEIQTLQAKIPGTAKAASDTAKTMQKLLDSQLEAEKKAEEARIALMEEGYEKRKAILDMEHRENLARIDKEQKELEKARKAAGQGELSDTELKGFDDRRNAENKAYLDAQSTLFDSELEYRKKQYELYWRWVRNMGKEVADAQFKDLLQGGSSYKDWVERQLSSLTVDDGADTPLGQRQGRSDLSEGQVNMLDTLKAQYSEMMGLKSATDLFKESLRNSISQASNLAERLEALAKAKEALANGRSGIVGEDEKAQALLYINEQDEQAQQELQNRVLTEYKGYESQRLSIQKQYAAERTASEQIAERERTSVMEEMEELRQDAIASGNEEELEAIRQRENERLAMIEQANQQRIGLINQSEQEALSTLNAQMLMQTDSWKNLFSDLDSMTVDAIDKLVREIETKMATADLNLNPSDLRAVLDRLDEAKQKVLDVNPFKALQNSLSAVFTTMEGESKKTSEQVKRDWKNLSNSLEGCFGFINNAIDSCDALSDMLGESGKATVSMIQGITMAGVAMATAIKNAERASIILTAISVALQAVNWVSSLFNNDAKYEKKIKKLQKQIDALESSYTRLDRAFNNTYWVFTDEQRAAYDQNVALINQQIAALEEQAVVARQSWHFVEYSKLTAQIKELKAALTETTDNEDMFTLYEKQKENLLQQQALIEQQIAAEKKKKNTDDDKIKQWQDSIEDIQYQLEDLEQQMMETLAGTSVQTAIDEFADAITDAFLAGEDAAEALGEKTKEVLKNAVVEALKRQYLAKAINDAVEYLGSAMEDSLLTDDERKTFEDMVNKAGETYKAALESIGDWILDADSTVDPLTGAIQSMSEETADVIAGRLNAVIINQAEQTNVLREALIYQSQIAGNTYGSWQELQEIRAALKRIENDGKSLLSQGIS